MGWRRPLGRPRHRGEDNIKMYLQEVEWGAWAGFSWLRTGAGGGILWMRWWTFLFHKIGGISWLAEDLLAFQEGLRSMALASSGGWLITHLGCFTPGKETRYPLHRSLSGPQGSSGRVRKTSPPPGFDPPTVQPVASRYTDYARHRWEDNIKMDLIGWECVDQWQSCGHNTEPSVSINGRWFLVWVFVSKEGLCSR
jgi:hypothetical protein